MLRKFISPHQGTKSGYLDLLVGRDGTEDDLCEALSWKHPEADAADDASVFDEGKGLVLSVDVSDVSRVKASTDTRL